MLQKVPGWLSAIVVSGIFTGLVLLEWRRPLRKKTSEPKLRRNIRNMAVAGTSAVAVILTSAPVTTPLTKWVHRRNCGLVKWLRLPCWLEVPLALILLDYSLYLWHVAFHKIPFLCRFHQVHHVDLDMDASTAIRFHFGEMAISTGLQTFQILTIGVSPLTFSIWNTWLISEVIFHHSNVELPFALERWLCKIIVTPRVHGIHHSLFPEELNSNWSRRFRDRTGCTECARMARSPIAIRTGLPRQQPLFRRRPWICLPILRQPGASKPHIFCAKSLARVTSLGR